MNEKFHSNRAEAWAWFFDRLRLPWEYRTDRCREHTHNSITPDFIVDMEGSWSYEGFRTMLFIVDDGNGEALQSFSFPRADSIAGFSEHIAMSEFQTGFAVLGDVPEPKVLRTLNASWAEALPPVFPVSLRHIEWEDEECSKGKLIEPPIIDTWFLSVRDCCGSVDRHGSAFDVSNHVSMKQEVPCPKCGCDRWRSYFPEDAAEVALRS
ncbi:hypothetical protein Q4494_00130 [Celeribacter halophilus]|uniref:Uncharacterized protein n=1 Tax=Celeribacter halophilus TaxID=576117 RepID=A0AAW7XMW9_9RHOB|nr:hypothetical protein [Celeribacter halophilus]MDO6455470.1 hypothetical protein [Celeribacter halophilus]